MSTPVSGVLVQRSVHSTHTVVKVFQACYATCGIPYQALRKKQLIADGKLGKFGKILDTTPVAIQEEFALASTKVR